MQLDEWVRNLVTFLIGLTGFSAQYPNVDLDSLYQLPAIYPLEDHSLDDMTQLVHFFTAWISFLILCILNVDRIVDKLMYFYFKIKNRKNEPK